MPLYLACAAIRTQTKTALARYGRDTSVALNGIRGPALHENEAIRTARYQPATQSLSKETIMTAQFAKRLVLALSLAAAAVGAQAAGFAQPGARDPYTEGARSVADARDPYSSGAHSAQEPRSVYSDGARQTDPYSDGARQFDLYTDGARTLAGQDRTGVSAEPARSVDPYLDGAYA